MEKLLFVTLALVASLLPQHELSPRHRRPRLYRGRRRGSAAQVLLQDHQWTRYLKDMGAWRRDSEVITI